MNQQSAQTGIAVFTAARKIIYVPAGAGPDANGQYKSKLQQDTAHPNEQSRTFTNQSFTNSVQCLDIFLLNRFHIETVHLRSTISLTDRYRILILILTGFNIGINVLKARQMDILTRRSNLSDPEVGTAIGFKSDPASRQLN